MSSSERSDAVPVDIAAGVPTTQDDVDALRGAKRHTSSWLMLSAAELDALIPQGALDRRPPTAATARPFELP